MGTKKNKSKGKNFNKGRRQKTFPSTLPRKGGIKKKSK